MSTLQVPGHFSRHGSQVLGSRTLRVAPHPVWGQVRHRHLGLNTHTRPQRPTAGSWTWSRADPSGSSKPGWPPSLTLGASASRSSRWVDSPGSKAPPSKNFPARERSWTPFMLCALLVMLSMSAAGVSSKNFTIGAGVPSSLTEIITLGRTLSRIK